MTSNISQNVIDQSKSNLTIKKDIDFEREALTYDPTADQLSEAIDTINSLLEEITELQDKLSVYQLVELTGEQFAVEETLKNLREQIRILDIDNRSLTIGRNSYQTKNSELIRALRYWKKRCDNAEKELKNA